MKNNLVYGLRDSRNDTYFYIGKTTSGIERPLDHLKNSHNQLVNDFVKEIELSNNEVLIDIIENNIDLNNLSIREKHWVKFYSKIYELLNIRLLYKEKEQKYFDVQNLDLNISNDLLILLRDTKNIVSNKRKKLKITQQYLAKKSGLNRSTITQIEKGENISLSSLISILEVLSNTEKQNQKVRIL